MKLLKQKRKTYMPPEIEVTLYEEEAILGDVSVNGPDVPAADGWAKSTGSFDDFEDDNTDDLGDDFNYESYRSEMLW